MGLATVYKIVKNHNGHINVYSEPGEGTVFNLYFPASEKEIDEPAGKSEIIKGDATILLVDDEENVREFSEKMLKNLGYQVLLAGNGDEAIRIFKENKKEIDLALLDMIMPKKAGKETYEELREIDPDVKVVLISGYSQNGKATEILNKGVYGFLQKPFSIAEISRIISDTLNT